MFIRPLFCFLLVSSLTYTEVKTFVYWLQQDEEVFLATNEEKELKNEEVDKSEKPENSKVHPFDGNALDGHLAGVFANLSRFSFLFNDPTTPLRTFLFPLFSLEKQPLFLLFCALKIPLL